MYLIVNYSYGHCGSDKPDKKGWRMQKEKLDLPIAEKLIWTVAEASKVTGISEAKIRDLTKQEDCPFVLRVGRLIKIKRKEFEEYLSHTRDI